jgi:membrane-bound metal-dependent hydrolase YbcI (DUF457 family)
MDIVTHAGIGLIAAAPLAGSQPELAVAIVAGSVLPDLDALGRLFGKRAFLRVHQTWSHALPVQAIVSVLAGFIAQGLGASGLMVGGGLFGGLMVHTLLDFTNTLGVTLVAPFSRKRFCLEWIFFIDATVLSLTAMACGVSIWTFVRSGEVPGGYAVRFFAVLIAYAGAKAVLRRRAGLSAPEAISLIPSALYPWRFLGVVDGGTRVQLLRVNALTGARSTLAEQETFDAAYSTLLSKIPEFRLMRELSPAYHVVDARKTDAGDRILCRDLRIRNFGTRFGELELLIDADERVKCVRFHV